MSGAYVSGRGIAKAAEPEAEPDLSGVVKLRDDLEEILRRREDAAQDAGLIREISSFYQKRLRQHKLNGKEKGQANLDASEDSARQFSFLGFKSGGGFSRWYWDLKRAQLVRGKEIRKLERLAAGETVSNVVETTVTGVNDVPVVRTLEEIVQEDLVRVLKTLQKGVGREITFTSKDAADLALVNVRVAARRLKWKGPKKGMQSYRADLVGEKTIRVIRIG
jgi:hypothetical protein